MDINKKIKSADIKAIKALRKAKKIASEDYQYLLEQININKQSNNSLKDRVDALESKKGLCPQSLII